MSGSIGNIAGSALGAGIARQGSSSGPKKPKEISTGFSTFTNYRRKPKFFLDPSIREGQESFLNNVRGLRSQVNPAFDYASSELDSIRDEVIGLRSDFEGNQSAFREASLNPLRERIARREGELDRELERAGVRGTFADQSRTNFQLDAGRELSDQEAIIERERINSLGNLLNMDADLLMQGLQTETGRINMLASLEESLRGVSTERFNQEMQQIGLAMGIPISDAQVAANQNRLGIERKFLTQLAGDIVGGIAGMGGSKSPTPGDIQGTPF